MRSLSVSLIPSVLLPQLDDAQPLDLFCAIASSVEGSAVDCDIEFRGVDQITGWCYETRRYAYLKSKTRFSFVGRLSVWRCWFLYQPFQNRVLNLTRIRVIELIKVVLKALNPQLMGIQNFFWGRGASIFGLGYEYLWRRGQVFLYSIQTQYWRRFEGNLTRFLGSPKLYSKITEYQAIGLFQQESLEKKLE